MQFPRLRAALWTAALVAVPVLASAQSPPPEHLQIPRVSTPPTLEDYLADGSHPGVAVTVFKQRQPKDLDPATEPTTAYLSYDASTLYAAFVCTSSNPAQIRARMAKREDMFSDDFVGVMLDTFLDKQRSYLFFVSPLGIQADGVTSAGSGDDYSFDTEWHSEGRLVDPGYVVFMAIPFKALRFPVTRDGAQHWGIGLIRSVPAKDEMDFWPGITNRINSLMGQFGVLDGISGVSPGRNIQLTPYGTFTGLRFLDNAASSYVKQTETRGGLDAKMVVHDAMTLDFTANPDFSQVESDDPQVTANQRFEVFFPEKRPFFLENSDIFNDAPQTLFFSRRVGDPQFGARMTGKVGQWALGGIVMDDRAPGRQEDPSSAAFGDRTYVAVGRARYDFSNESRIGFFGTTREFGPTSNHVGEVDTRIRMGPKWVLSGQAVTSATTALDGSHSTGMSAYADLSRSGRYFSYDLTYVDASPNFKAELGFVPRVDYRQVSDYFALRWFPKKGPLIDFGPNSFVQGTWNYAGQLQDWIIRLPFQLDFKGQTGLFGRHAFISEHVSGVELRQHEDLIQFNSDRVSWMGINVTYNHGTRPNYAPAAGLLPFLGMFTDVSMGLTVRLVSALRIDETYLYSRLDSRRGSPGTGLIFSNPIFRSKATYQFSREWSLRAILDYSALTPTTSLIALDRTRHAGADLLLTWLPHPGTALYIGYTDGYDNLRIDPVTGIQPTAGALSSTGRQIFVKMSWLFRF